MKTKLTVGTFAAVLLFSAGAALAQTVSPIAPSPVVPSPERPQVANNCEFGEHIDGSTMADAKRRIMAGGYSDVRDLRKGCDNVWHGMAMRDGRSSNVALEPGGQVFQETD